MTREESRRDALLLGSTIHLAGGSNQLDRRVRDSHLDDISTVLTSLGDYSFGWGASRIPKRLVNPEYYRVQEILDQDLQPPTRGDIFLLYYLGHGYPGRQQGELVVGFKNVSLEKDTTDFTINAAIRKIQNHGYRRIIVVLDCCHAGLLAPTVTFNGDAPDYFLMMSSGRGWQHLTRGGAAFSKTLCDVFRAPGNVMPLDHNLGGVSFAGWYNATVRAMKESGLTVESQCRGDLGKSTVFFKRENVIPTAVDLSAPRKSTYQKLYWLLTIMSGRPESARQVHERISRQPRDVFQISMRVGSRIETRIVSVDAVARYLELCVRYGLANKEGDRFARSRRGERAIQNEGAGFNRVLVDQIIESLPDGMDISKINAILDSLLEQRRAPVADEVERYLLNQDQLQPVSRRELRDALSLLAYGRAVRRAPGETYFPT